MLVDLQSAYDTDISQSNVATHLKCDEIFSDSFITNFLLIFTVKEFWKSVNIWRSWGVSKRCHFWPTLYRFFKKHACLNFLQVVQKFCLAHWQVCLSLCFSGDGEWSGLSGRSSRLRHSAVRLLVQLHHRVPRLRIADMSVAHWATARRAHQHYAHRLHDAKANYYNCNNHCYSCSPL